MSEFARTKAMRQFYRDIFTRQIDLPEADAMPAHVVAEIFSFRSGDMTFLEPMIAAASTGLDTEKEDALKNMLRAIALANQALEIKGQSQQKPFPVELSRRITEYVVAALKADNNTHYIVAAIQILFRVNEISSALFLINNNLSLVSDSGIVLKILLLVCLMEDDYNQAMVVIQALTADASLIGEDPMTLLMITCGIYKLGGLPDSFIDFRTLDNSNYPVHDAGYTWLLEKECKVNTTVLVACDKGDYFAHTLPLVSSLYETNRGVLDVHLHLFNSDDEVKESVRALREQLPELHISATLEQVSASDDMPAEFAARRILFLCHAMQAFTTPVIALNSDVLVRQAWVSPGAPLLLLENETSPFWEEIFPGFIYAEPGSLSGCYFATVARFISCNLKADNLVWCLGPVALSASLDRLSGTEQMAISRVARASILGDAGEAGVFCWAFGGGQNAEESSQQYSASLIQKYQR